MYLEIPFNMIHVSPRSLHASALVKDTAMARADCIVGVLWRARLIARDRNRDALEFQKEEGLKET